jgi:hypothetical protein
MLQRHSVPHLPPTRPDTLLEMPPVISLLPDIADHVVEAPFGSQKLVHGGDGSTTSDLPSAPPIWPPSSSVHPHTPPSTYHSLPPDIPLPTTPPARFPPPPLATPCPQRLRCPRDQWLPEQWAVPDRYKLPREPTPAVASSDEVFLDNCTLYAWITLLHNKASAITALKQWLALIKNHMPQKNGCTECSMHTIMDKAQAMCLDACLPQS